MHNRVRMVTASFLVKDLHLWWPLGARHFLDQLSDGDVASNSHGWQWVAGTGTDAAREADRTDERFQMLVEYPGWNTVMADGRVAHCDWAEIVSAAHEEPYGAESVVTRFVSEYRLGISRVSAL